VVRGGGGGGRGCLVRDQPGAARGEGGVIVKDMDGRGEVIRGF